MPTVTIIVPVYRAIHTLGRCVQSISSQSFRDFQLLLVDDGSTDVSGQLCDVLATADERIQVIHQVNAGVSQARNAGLAAAVGEWIVFVDADDVLAPHALESALAAQTLHPQRWVVWPHITTSPQQLPAAPSGEGQLLGPEKLAYLYRDCCLSMPWNKLYKRSVLEEGTPLRFDPAYSLGEDLLFCLDYANRWFAGTGEGFFQLKEPQTFYEQGPNPDSLTQRYRSDFCQLWTRLFARLLADCRARNCPPADLVHVWHSYLTTLCFGITDELNRGPGTPAQRHKRVAQFMAQPCCKELCRQLWRMGYYAPLATALALRSPRLVSWLWQLRQTNPDLYGKAQAIGQMFCPAPGN